MTPDRGSGYASARRALQIALLNEERFQNVLDRVACFTDRRCKVVDPHRPAAEFLQHRAEQLAIHDVEAEMINVEHGQGIVSHLAGNVPIGSNFGKVSHSSQQAIGNAWRTARAARDFKGAIVGNFAIQQLR